MRQFFLISISGLLQSIGCYGTTVYRVMNHFPVIIIQFLYIPSERSSRNLSTGVFLPFVSHPLPSVFHQSRNLLIFNYKEITKCILHVFFPPLPPSWPRKSCWKEKTGECSHAIVTISLKKKKLKAIDGLIACSSACSWGRDSALGFGGGPHRGHPPPESDGSLLSRERRYSPTTAGQELSLGTEGTSRGYWGTGQGWQEQEVGGTPGFFRKMWLLDLNISVAGRELKPATQG